MENVYKYSLGLVDGDECLHFEFETYNEMIDFVRTAFRTSTRKDHLAAVINCKKKEVTPNE